MLLAEILVILFLVLGNALLAMSELAVISSRRSRLQELVKSAIAALAWQCACSRIPRTSYRRFRSVSR
jgi:CBS domain containing-hemolysin-like protein